MVAPFLPSVTTDCVLDISHHQGDVDFSKLKSAGIAAVFIKATEGATGHDPLWGHNSYWAAQAGLMFAPYHFVTNKPVAEQFANFMAVASPGEGSVVMLDFEHNPSGDDASADQVAEFGAMVQKVTGRAPLMYCGRYQMKTAHKVLSAWPLMLPEFGDEPVCPPGWDSWLFHQYRDDAEIAGVKGHVDRSVFAGTLAELEAWWQTGAMPKTEPVKAVVKAEPAKKPEPVKEPVKVEAPVLSPPPMMPAPSPVVFTEPAKKPVMVDPPKPDPRDTMADQLNHDEVVKNDAAAKEEVKK